MSTESGLSVYDKHYINGEWVSSSNQDNFCEVYDSNNGEPFAKIVKGTKEDVDKAILAAYDAFPQWAALSVQRRKEYLQRLMEEYNNRKDEIAEALRRELGAPKIFAHKTQVEMMNMHLKAAIELADIFNWEEIVHNTWIVKEPIGVVACITPWNWPLNQIGCKIAPGLLAGNTIVLKPSEVTPICAHLFGEAVEAAQLPPGVLNIVFGQGAELGEAMATHPKVDMVSFTGSTKVGSLLHKAGGETIKRVRTELGGKSAAIILDDATPEQIEMMSTQVLTNSGQTCDALSRLLVPRSRYDEVLKQVKEVYEKVKVIDATSDDDSCVQQGCKTIGPLSSKKQQDKVLSYIKKGQEEGAKILVGGDDKPEGMNGNGYFVRPTVFYDVDNRMTIAQEEIFGPVLCIIPYSDVEEAIRIANDTIFGLNNAVAGKDIEKAKTVARKLASGRVQVNTLEVNEHAPFGGYKQSGDGREWGKYGLEDFIQVKGINLPSDQITESPETKSESSLYKESRSKIDEKHENKSNEQSQYNPDKESEEKSSGGMMQRLKEMAGFQSAGSEQKPDECMKQEGQEKMGVESIAGQGEQQRPLEKLKQKFEENTQQSEEGDKNEMEQPLEGIKEKAKEKTGLQSEEGEKEEQQSVENLKKMFEGKSSGQSSGKEIGEQHPLEDTKEKLKETTGFQSKGGKDEENPLEDTKEKLKEKVGLQSKAGKDEEHPLEDTKDKLKEKTGVQSEESDKNEQHPVEDTKEKLKEKTGLQSKAGKDEEHPLEGTKDKLKEKTGIQSEESDKNEQHPVEDTKEKLKEETGLQSEEGGKGEQHPLSNIKEKIKEKTGFQSEEGEKSEEHPIEEMKEKFKEKSGFQQSEEKGEEQAGQTLDEKVGKTADQRVDEKLEKTVERKADQKVEQKVNEKVEEKVDKKIEEKSKYASEETEGSSGKKSNEKCELKSEEECEQKCL